MYMTALLRLEGDRRFQSRRAPRCGLVVWSVCALTILGTASFRGQGVASGAPPRFRGPGANGRGSPRLHQGSARHTLSILDTYLQMTVSVI
jgi:hypothetical protein